MRIAFGTDDDTTLTMSVVEHLKSLGHDVEIVGGGQQWPEVGRAVGNAVAAARAERGVVCCYTGTGVSIAANKVPGVRAALCSDAITAAGARRWNDANVLAFGLRLTSVGVAREMIDAFLDTEPDVTEREAIARVEPR
ncbi:MAG: RpiB/LacA/LacB family sugar-phosphate isomerase [Acidimicrobiales bacterium]